MYNVQGVDSPVELSKNVYLPNSELISVIWRMDALVFFGNPVVRKQNCAFIISN